MKRPEFTKEHEYWICDIIGYWYLLWKDRIADYKTGTHSLGYAKEQLKQMLFEEDKNEYLNQGCKL